MGFPPCPPALTRGRQWGEAREAEEHPASSECGGTDGQQAILGL